ncbi:hypothetical protein HDV63DRAFT_351337 [Trichoderma sp. SZMC 28014]
MSATCLDVCCNCTPAQPATARVAAIRTREREIDAWLQGGTASNEIGQSQDCHDPAKLLPSIEPLAVEAWKQVQYSNTGLVLLEGMLQGYSGIQVVDAQTRTSIISNTPYRTPYSIGTRPFR